MNIKGMNKVQTKLHVISACQYNDTNLWLPVYSSDYKDKRIHKT